MDKYTIPCTEEQTKKALKLGAPINLDYHKDDFENSIKIRNLCYAEAPTAEQMIGWLEEIGVLVDINPINGLHFNWILRTKELDEGSNQLMWESQYTTFEHEYNSRKEATLAAIDAALKYLTVKNND